MSRHISRIWAAAVLVLPIGLVAGMLEAATTVVDPITGHLLIVDVIADTADPTLQGIRYRERSPMLVTIEDETIPSTFDIIEDTAPAISLNPMSGGVVVVWSRHDGGDFELALARREGGGWSNHRILTTNNRFDTEPRVLVDSDERAHVLWWGDGPGGPVILRSFDPLSGDPLGPPHRPFDMPQQSIPRPRSVDPHWDAGGLDDPGIPTISASAVPCGPNPQATPDHGVVMSCGHPAAYQLSNCSLVVGVQEPITQDWNQTHTNLSSVDLSTTSVREIVQSIADFHCHQ